MTISISDIYTGDVSDQREAQRRITPHAQIVKMSVGPMDNNTYVVMCSQTRVAAIIDAADDADTILTLVRQLDIHPEYVITTHRHPDHWQALADVTAALSVRTAASRADADGIPVVTDAELNDGDEIAIGTLSLSVITLVGHTPGSIALALSDDRTHLFTGDSLFPGGVGKTNSPNDFATLLDDVSKKLFGRFDDDTAVYPGHGTDTTLGAERPHLPSWRERGW